MTLLGFHSPLLRLANAVRGLGRRPVPRGPRDEVFVVGHRGAPRHAPENTVESFAKAIELGADAIETDVCVTRDGRFVLWHDCQPDDKVALVRQASGEGYLYEPDVPPVGSPWRRPVRDLDLADFLAHHGYVRSDDGRGKGRVPVALLEDFFTWARDTPELALLCLDVKLGEKETGAVRNLARLLRDARRAGRLPEHVGVAMLCPQKEVLMAALTESRLEDLGEGIRVFADFEFPGVLDFASRYGARCVSMGVRRRFWTDFSDELGEVLAARDAGRIESAIVWTENDEERLRELVALGVDGILTDEPALLRGIVGPKTGRPEEVEASR
ncbi:MAG: glycerophosphodiester phosphodiesterase family protein [Acidobacteriota bacterium]